EAFGILDGALRVQGAFGRAHHHDRARLEELLDSVVRGPRGSVLAMKGGFGCMRHKKKTQNRKKRCTPSCGAASPDAMHQAQHPWRNAGRAPPVERLLYAGLSTSAETVCKSSY